MSRVNLGVVVTPASGGDLVVGYPEKYAGEAVTARSVAWAAHKEALLDALNVAAAEGLGVQDAYYGVCEYVPPSADRDHGGYYREVVLLDFPEVIEAVRTNGRSVGRAAQRLYEQAKREKSDPVKVEPRDPTVSADTKAGGKDETFVDLKPAGEKQAERPEPFVNLAEDSPPAVSAPDTVGPQTPVPGPTPFVDLWTMLFGLPRQARPAQKCGVQSCKACYPTGATASADGSRPNGVGRG